MGFYKDTGWVPLVLEGAWVNYQTSPVDWAHAAYRIKSNGDIHLRGLIANGALNTAIARIPFQHVPDTNLMYTVFTNTGAGRMDLARKASSVPGALILRSGGNAYVTLDGIVIPVVR